MEKYSKVLFFISGVLLIIVGVPTLILSTWTTYLEYTLYAALFFFFMAVVINYKTIIDFFSMKTTKHGLNMGTLIFLGIFLMFCVNFIAIRNDFSIDITKEKLNSLSLQSIEVLDSLKKEVSFKVFYQGEMHANDNIGLKTLFAKYKRESSKVKTSFIDAHKDPSSVKYLSREDKGQLVVILEQGQKRERVALPISEESITSALFRLLKTDSKKVYFLTGHGERGFEPPTRESAEGLSGLVASLKDKGFEVSTLNLIESKKVPGDAAMVAIIGPEQDLVENEIAAITEYAVDGGRLLIAADPKSDNNLNEITKRFGIELDQTYLLTVKEVSPLTVYGQKFDPTSPITKKFKQGTITLFDEATELKKTQALPNSLKVYDLVKTAPITVAVKDLRQFQQEAKGQEPRAVTVAMTAEGYFGDTDHEGHSHGNDFDLKDEFAAAVFGDTDFLSDTRFSGFNKDLALNSFAFLAQETNLISIRPRVPEDTKLVLTSSYQTFAIIFSIFGPLVLLIMSLLLWLRRRGA